MTANVTKWYEMARRHVQPTHNLHTISGFYTIYACDAHNVHNLYILHMKSREMTQNDMK